MKPYTIAKVGITNLFIRIQKKFEMYERYDRAQISQPRFGFYDDIFLFLGIQTAL